MPPLITTNLTVPADKRFLRMIADYVRDLAATAGLAREDVRGLELAAEEAFTNILQHAYPDGSQGGACIQGRITQTELILSIGDKGVPFDPSYHDRRRNINQESEQETEAEMIGFRLMRHSVDEVIFENLGSQGKLLQLVKRLPLEVEAKPRTVPREIEGAPFQHYDIRPMRPEEAIQVAKVFWLAYGYSYKNEAIYHPEDLTHLVGSGSLFSFVAVAENGEVVGHAGLLSGGQSSIAEMVSLVIAPAHRGRGLMEALHMAVENKAEEMRLRGVFVSTITSHAISQWDVIRFGGKPCGLELSAGPPQLFKTLVENKAERQRESCFHCFKYLCAPPEVVVHVPERHRKMASRIYENLDQPFRIEDARAASNLAGDYQVHFDRTMLKGVIKVVSADRHLWPEISRATRDLFEYAGSEVIYLDLPLAQPDCAALCELAEREGYFFSGIKPMEAEEGDNLRLQSLRNPIDMTRLHIHPGFGKELFDYVASLITP